MHRTVTFSMIGAGKAARALARAIHDCPRARLARVMSPSGESAARLAAEFGVPLHGSRFEEAVRDPAVDAVVLATPNRVHCEQALAAFEAGKHVLCEKPMCNTEAEAQAMLGAAVRAGRHLMIGFTERFNQPCLDAHARILRGEIGRPVMLLARRCHPKTLVRDRAWINDDETGGVLHYAGAHNIDLACWFLGDRTPERVYAEMGRLVHPASQRFTDSAVATLRFPDGGIAALYESFGYPSPYPHGVDRSIEILGTEGRILLDFMRQPLVLDSAAGHAVSDATTWPQVPDGAAGAAGQEIRQFVALLLDQIQNPAPGTAGLRALRIALAARRAATTGIAQTLPAAD